jgi:hypothetical protein
LLGQLCHIPEIYILVILFGAVNQSSQGADKSFPLLANLLQSSTKVSLNSRLEAWQS